MSLVPLPVTNSSVTGIQKHSTTTTAFAVSTLTNMANSNAVNNKQQMEQNNNNNNINNTSNTNIVKKQTTKAAQDLKATTTATTHEKQIKEMPTTAANTTTLSSSASNTTALSSCSKTLTTTAAASSTTMPVAKNVTNTTTSATTSHCDSSSISSSSSSSVSISDCQQSCDAIIKTELESLDSASDNAAETLDDDLADSNDLQLAAMRQRPITLSSVNPHIICSLCFGYLIDATTIVECLHSFCHSCLIKHLRTEQYCPRCEMMINTAKPNIKPDTTLQAIVYKLVPGLYEKELMRKRAFYKDRPEEAALATPEQRGDDTEHLIFSPSDYMSISLEYADIEEHMKSNAEYNELLKPRYLKCPAMCTVAHLKKFVFGKFEINNNRFTIDIMYKVKTIVLLDHYTLMDVAYIYTWKRDAPMRFYFRVKQSLKPLIRVKKNLVTKPKKEISPTVSTGASLAVEESKLHSKAMCIVHEPTPSIAAEVSAATSSSGGKILEPEEIKQENESEVSSTTEIPSATSSTASAAASAPTLLSTSNNEQKQFEIIQPQSPSVSSHDSTLTDKLKITLVHKAIKDKADVSNSPCPKVKTVKEKKENHKTSTATAATMPKDERKVENIKLKIDLSKQNSVTIINMSDPERKEIVKPVKPEKEWKVKTKKEKDGSPKSSPKSSPHSERKSKTPSPLTVPPLTIKAERISPLAKTNTPPLASEEDDKKSQFLKSFALTPIKSIKTEKVDTKALKNSLKEFTHSIINKPFTKDHLQQSAASSSSSSKRKSKEPMKTVVKKPKLSPPLATEDFKIKLPPIINTQPQSTTSTAATTTSSVSHINNSTSSNSKILMPPPAPVTTMKPPASLPKKLHKPAHQTKLTAAAPGSLTPHPMHTGNNGIQLVAPGSRTPIAKRFQPILPKTPRVNPFANIPSDVNKLLKDAGTEIKSIPKEPVTAKVYGPKTDSSPLMGPPPMPAPTNHKTQATQSSNAARNSSTANAGKQSSTGSGNKNNSYLNLALFNASKSKGNEVPPGCRTPMYTPNSPIYSPSSPQYVPNYNIPTMPTYKYTPKPSGSGNSYLQSVLGGNNQMSSLFPSPPVKKDASNANNNANNSGGNNSTSANALTNRNEHQQPKRVYPFARSPSPVEDPPEKQLKVKCLLNSCNINIPSSLSITITREDGETSSNGAAYPKHKSPVNNYIEILKLPDQSHADNNENKRLSPPIQNTNTNTGTGTGNNSLFPNPPIRRVATPPPPLPQASNTAATTTPTNAKQSNMTSPTTAGKQQAAATNISPNMNLMNKQNNNNNNGPNKSPTTMPAKPTTPTNNNKSPVTGNDKKTPSPEKRLSSSTLNDQKSPNSSQGDNSAGKKFRHILPRQIVKNTTNDATTTNNTPKPCVNAGNVIGTYSSPNGVNVKIHSNTKKVQTAKKSPGAGNQQTAANNGILNKNFQQQQQQQSPQTTAANAAHHNGVKAPGKSPQTGKNSCKTVGATAAANSQQILNTNSAANKLSPPTAANMQNLATAMPSALTHPMQAMLPPHLAAAGQAELGKFLKENLLRAQVQAAVANQSNMFYPYAANAAAAAAQLGQFNPTMYNYQQAYIMDQLSRMQRAGTEAFSEYMQKLKNSMEANKTTNESLAQQQQQQHAKPAPPPSMPLAKNLSSPKASAGSSLTGQSINNNSSMATATSSAVTGVATTAATANAVNAGKDQQLHHHQQQQQNQMTKTK